VKAAQYNTDIECLRAIAVLCVAFHHMQGNLFHPGLPILSSLFQHSSYWFGVDLFFAISGYVIGRSLLPQMMSHRNNLSQRLNLVVAFWIRRAWRLLPSAWLWLAIMLAAALFLNRSGAFGSLHANVMASLAGALDVANFRFADAFFRYEYGASFVYWSLSLEEQFYLLLPILVLCLRRRVDAFLLALFIVQLFLYRTPLLMVLRTDALALGVLLSIIEPSRIYAKAAPAFLTRLHSMRWLVLLALLGFLSVLASFEWKDLTWRVSAIALISATLVWIASYNDDYLLPRGAIKNLLIWIGSRSYAIYLIHIPVYFLIREIDFRLGMTTASPTPLYAVTQATISLGLTMALADLNYRFIEQPLRHHGRAIADRYLSGKGVDTSGLLDSPQSLMLSDTAKSML
jgi:peptidoglycan/LPS O-acetylase OafA/YrhL